VISGRTNTVTATVVVGTNPFGVAVNPKTGTAFVTNLQDDAVVQVTACPVS